MAVARRDNRDGTTALNELPRLAIFYGGSSSSILQIADAAQHICRIVWIVGWMSDEPPIRELSHFGEVVDLTNVDESQQVASVVATHSQGVVVFNDAPMVLAAEIAHELGLPFHSLETARLLTDKFAQRRALQRAGVPTPAFSVVRSGGVESDVPFPAVLKPRVGAGARNTFKVEGREQLEAALALCPDGEEFILEEWLADRSREGGPRSDQVSVESMARGGRIENITVTGYFPFDPPFRESGYFIPSDFDENEWGEVVDMATSAVEALGVQHGLVHVEVKLTPEGPRIIEVNGRIGGSRHELITRIGGPPLREWAMRLALGQDVGPIPPMSPSPVSFIRYANAPMSATQFISVTGAKEVRDLPGVLRLRMNRQPGDVVDYRRGIPFEVVVRIDGLADSHSDLWRLVHQQIAQTLQFEWRE